MNPIIVCYLVIVTAAFTIPVMFYSIRDTIESDSKVPDKIVAVTVKIVFAPIYLLLVGHSIWRRMNVRTEEEQPE